MLVIKNKENEENMRVFKNKLNLKFQKGNNGSEWKRGSEKGSISNSPDKSIINLTPIMISDFQK